MRPLRSGLIRRIGSLVSYQIAIPLGSASSTLGSSLPRIMTLSCHSNSLDPRRLPKWAMSAPAYWPLTSSLPLRLSAVSAHRTRLFVTTRVRPILSAAQDRHPDHLAPLLEGPFDFLRQFLSKLVSRDEDRGLRRNAGLVEVVD